MVRNFCIFWLIKNKAWENLPNNAFSKVEVQPFIKMLYGIPKLLIKKRVFLINFKDPA